MVRQGFHNNDDINFLSNVLGALSSYCVVTSDSLSSSLQIDENIISHDFKQENWHNLENLMGNWLLFKVPLLARF